MPRFPWTPFIFLALASCAKPGIGGKPEEEPSPFGPGGVPPQLKARTPQATASLGTPVTPDGNTPSQGRPATLNLTPEDDIKFTDPDNPDASLPELSAILTAPKKHGPWEQSESVARQRAALEGKPLLIWFTDSARSPMCNALSQELFSTPQFEKWASEKLVRLRVDANLQADDPDLSLDEKESRRVDLKHYVTRLEKTYKVLGHPSVVLLNPGGEVIGHYRGYKRGDADFFWGRIKHGEAVAANAYKEWRVGMEKKGYREWSDRKDRKLFAKLASYSNGTLVLIQTDGTRCQTQESNLSDKDRSWIAEQKKLRNMQ
jgi:thioredoxin-related protein